MARHSFTKWLAGLGLLLGFVVAMLLPCAPAFAQTQGGWDSVPLTANSTTNKEPHIAGEYVVWQAYDGIDWEIILYDLSSNRTRQLTNDVDQTDPRVDGTHVLWVAHEVVPVLVLYDLNTSATLRIPQSEGVQGAAEIKGDLVVWQTGAPASSEIYVYDIKTGSTRKVTTDPSTHSSLATDGRFVVFVSTPRITSMEGPSPSTTGSFLYLYDTQSDTLRQLPTGGDELRAQVADGLVVWQEGTGHAAEIVLYEAVSRAVTYLTNDSVRDAAPVVGGGKVAWLSWSRPDDMQMPHDSPWKVMLFDTATRNTSMVKDGALSVAIDADGNTLVWSHWTMGPEYAVYDVSSGQSSNLGPGGLASFGADLDRGRVVWWSYPPFRFDEDTTIYLAAQGGLPPAAIAPTSPIREFADIASSPYRDAIEQLAGLGIARGYRTLVALSRGDTYLQEFRPEQPALRWQFLKMLLAVSGISPTEYTNQPPFLDIQALEGTGNHNLRYYVEAGLKNDIIQGVTSTRFAPFGSLSRAQAVTMLVRAARAVKPGIFDGQTGLTGLEYQPYVRLSGSLGDFSSVHAENMRVAEQSGLLEKIVGFGPSWDPWAPMTRGEAAQLIVNLEAKL